MSMLMTTNSANHDQPEHAAGGVFCGRKTAWISLVMLGVVGVVGAEVGPSIDVGVGAGSDKQPLWQVAIERMREQGGYVAACVETELKVYNGDEKLLGTVTEVERMERTGKTIRWVTLSKNKSGSPGMAIKADFGLQSNPASALEGYDQWCRRRVGEYGGGPIEVWEGITVANPQNSILAYIDPASGFLKKAEFTMPYRSPVGSIVVKGELTCQRWSGDIWLPSRITMDQNGSLFLIRRHLRMVKTYKEWQPRARGSLSAITRIKADK